ncbi:hypothetical protein Despr_2458 [Desulfobulbus propionicus DSM 2032]|uniref:Sulfate transporter n=1 Tax=Desulfobulbus propionicus (strain ATCC 33891 / DSM 2032 / VKM B-1956 / 1pr3) TaxID=577650 RepID=A0A7U4DQ27_DESPD|nr:DUF3164 family protein [Desulfobulbus propionicus]ADW18597.1 hypothetical protein Despr_2458 [Desulfobulbus propionicus DSM 2032]
MDWISLLRRAVQIEGSQASVAGKLGYSPAAISQVLNNNYSGSLEAISEKVLTVYGGKTMQAIPDGYMRNAVGHLVPIESIKEIDLARDEFVKEVVHKAKDLAATVTTFKKQLATDLEAFLDLSAEKYGVTLGGVKGNINLVSFDGRYKVLRDVSERLDFDERLQAAKALIDECLREWTKDSGSEVRTLIEAAFQVDKKGKINTKRILGLRKLDIKHPTWIKAMEAIGDAITVTGSCTYYRVYERDEKGEYRQVNLDFSGIA